MVLHGNPTKPPGGRPTEVKILYSMNTATTILIMLTRYFHIPASNIKSGKQIINPFTRDTYLVDYSIL